MATDRQVGKKVSSFVRQEDTPGLRIDPGPYVGIVKNVLDDLRAGRLEVYIPELGGPENDPKFWRLVNYASPFFGSTQQPFDNKSNRFDKTEHTYGMWFVPPDIGNQVLVTFVMGDPNRGYWFACVNHGLSHHMVPGLASAKKVNKNDIVDGELKKSLTDDGVYPAAEFNTKDASLSQSTTFLTNPRTIHEYQAKVLINQGLDRDAVRGAISSSSQREVPSGVFGISTPGRPLGAADTAENYVDYANKLNDRKLTAKDYQVAARKGGHTFVMDDGDAAGNDQLVRLRTAGGHQILMNDKEKILYISNSEGSVWIELAGSGHMHIYSGRGVNVRTQGDFNLHSDQNININAGGSVNISAKKTLTAESQACFISAQNQAVFYGNDVGIGSNGALKLSSAALTSIKAGGSVDLVGSTINLNSSAAASVSQPTRLLTNLLSDTIKDQTTKLWVNKSSVLSTITTVAPAHEPWPRQGTKSATSPSPQVTPNQGATTENVAQVSGSAVTANIEDYIDAGLMVKAPCTISATGNTSKDSINSLSSPEYTSTLIECGQSGTVLDLGPRKALAYMVPRARLVPKDYMSRKDNPDPPGSIGPLTAYQVKAVMTAMGFRESAWKYSALNQFGYAGKYQFGAAALTDRGFIKPDYYKQQAGNKNQVLNKIVAWTAPNQDNIYSIESWLAAAGTQERVMYEQMAANYKTMLLPGNKISSKRLIAEQSGIRQTDDICTIAGMLCVAHLLGAAGATLWRHGKGASADAFGTTGEEYFNIGKYAVDVLARTTAPTPSTPSTPSLATAAVVQAISSSVAATPTLSSISPTISIRSPVGQLTTASITINGVTRQMTLDELQDMRAQHIARGPLFDDARGKQTYKTVLETIDKAIAQAKLSR